MMKNFFRGINIIHGSDNGVGKSTIADLLFFGLGGEVHDWIEQIKKDEIVYLEISINNKPLTLKRSLESAFSPLAIHEGTLVNALAKDAVWFVYPYARSKNQKSFTQALFLLLGFPEPKTDLDDNLTFNQILRLLYEDQLTPVGKIFKQLNFDKPATRKAIYEFLTGIDDFEVYMLKNEIKNNERTVSSLNGEMKGLMTRLGIEGNDFEQFKDKLVERQREIGQEISNDQLNINEKLQRQGSSGKNENKRTSNLLKEIAKNRGVLLKLEEQSRYLKNENEDSIEFVSCLLQRVEALRDSQKLLVHLGEIDFKYCPSCLGEISQYREIGKCLLCHNALTEGNSSENRLRMEMELSFQIRESEKLIETRNLEIQSIEKESSSVAILLKDQERELESLNNSVTEFDANIRIKIQEVGYKERELDHLKEKIQGIKGLNELWAKIQGLQKDIDQLNSKVKSLEETQEGRKIQVSSFIQNKTLSIIKNDLAASEDVFGQAEEVIVDFMNDRVFVDGKVRFSASALPLLKNATMLSLFLASLEFDYFRMPHFMLLDNIEDKGMLPKRSHLFQETIIKYCPKDRDDYQLIFTTSMLAPTLENSKFIVGRCYSQNAKALTL